MLRRENAKTEKSVGTGAWALVTTPNPAPSHNVPGTVTTGQTGAAAITAISWRGVAIVPHAGSSVKVSSNCSLYVGTYDEMHLSSHFDTH